MHTAYCRRNCRSENHLKSLKKGLETHPFQPKRNVDIKNAAGDLTKRKLLPALYNPARQNYLPEEFAIVGVGREKPLDILQRRYAAGEMTTEEYKQRKAILEEDAPIENSAH